MKKSLIALAALSAFATAAQAQSSVSVYGIVDMGYVNADYTNVGGLSTAAYQQTVKGLNAGGASAAGASASSRIGFRGTEDLGGGLTAGFNYELGFTPASTTHSTGGTAGLNDSSGATYATNNGALANTPREAKVSIGSKALGTIELGYGTTGLHSTIAGHRALGGSNFVGDLAYASDSISSADQRIHANAVRANGLTYKSPVFSGLSARVDVGQGGDRTDATAGTNSTARNLGVTVNYTTGALSVAATQHNYYVQSAANVASVNYEYSAVSAKYQLTSALALDALYAKRESMNGATRAQSTKDDVMQAGIKYTMGKTDLIAMYGTGEGETTAAGVADKERTGMMLGAFYNFSKRTAVYGLYGKQEMKYVQAGTNITAGTKETVDAYTVGLRHSF